MFARPRRILARFFNKSRKINNEPLNKVSLIVIILIDIFILVNVFTGLDDISRWQIAPSQSYPCYVEWQNYQTQTNKDTIDKKYELLKLSLPVDNNTKSSFVSEYRQAEEGHLGKVSETCLKYADSKDKINNSTNQQALKGIDQKQAKITNLEQTSRTIRSQYDSTLLEKIAGQSRNQSINSVGAEKAKQTLDQNTRTISTLKKEISNLKNELIAKPESISFIAFLNDDGKFNEVEKGYRQASFWYPSIQFGFQSLFLLPLIFLALLVQKFSQRKGYGLISLISWHLLVIFFIPLIFKIFEFLQVGVIFQFLVDIISALFGRLLFLISYLYILIIPLVGFGLIKFFQKFVFNTKAQVAIRVQRSCCVNCAKTIRHHDSYCPHCGYYQYVECQNCHNLTYEHLPYCKQCGHSQEPSKL
ncbi:hypothetical protein Cri9333_0061 [Crinalium epipsammum PCC 9333]|uniref:DZANK-type domain-containing protein n=1 Tax=Crinalium epipsammum PCC 9333 TaxID=1173022 RepID=K9VT23_9CYAN|nr:hypothetical protein [Crinalium epipsammum]AFZ11061.1 hypothetical protein Cri9333_0061 [Crinalium epipsammum PCC 9333]